MQIISDGTIPAISVSDRHVLHMRLSDKLETAYQLNRQLVSFQANKHAPIYRWFKYKEGFSQSLVQYFLTTYGPKLGKKKLLDPFAGTGTSLFAGQEMGWEGYGIELLPVGNFVMQIRETLNHIKINELEHYVERLWKEIDSIEASPIFINHIPITKDAFSTETENYLNRYLFYCSTINNEHIQKLLRFASFSILEEISFTRKDGQYLRWDYRTSRNLSGKPFDKGKIFSFREALTNKLNQFISDIKGNDGTLFPIVKNDTKKLPKTHLIEGSCLTRLPELKDDFFDILITSPPYCNRYDYTRTYALELVFLGNSNEQVRDLRQTMLSCTVENKEKVEELRNYYTSIKKGKTYDSIIKIYETSDAMAEVNKVLDDLRNAGKLNNSNIARMVKNYFLEMCFVIYEMHRVLKKGAYCIMVNDNVKYGGEEIPVDLILSDFAEQIGFFIERILVLPKGKGNSSQQMGNFGRTEVRKCVYVWKKL